MENRLRRAVWPGAIAVAIVAAVAGAGVMRPLQQWLADKNMTAYDKIHGTNIHSNYLIEGNSVSFDDYCAIDQKKLAAIEKEEMVIVATIGDESKKEALRYIVISAAIMLLGYIIVFVYLKK